MLARGVVIVVLALAMSQGIVSAGVSVTPTVKVFHVPTANSHPQGVAKDHGGNIWFTETSGNKIGRVTPLGVFKEFPLPAGSEPKGITLGPDGNLWFTEQGSGDVARITTGGAITQFAPPTLGDPESIAAGPDQALWFTERSVAKIGRVTTSGALQEFALPTPADPTVIAPGPGGLWFTDYSNNKIGRITTAGNVTEFAAAGNPGGIVEGPDGNMWFTEYGAGKVAKITPAGKITAFALPSGGGSQPAAICLGPDRNLWVAEAAANKFAQVTPAGKATEISLPAGSGPVAIADPGGTIDAASYDGNDIIEYTISAKAIAVRLMIQDLNDAVFREQGAIDYLNSGSVGIAVSEVIISRDGYLRNVMELGKTVKSESANADTESALDTDEAVVNLLNSKKGGRIKKARGMLEDALVDKKTAIATLQSLVG